MAKKKGARGKPLPAVMLDLIVGYWVSELVHVVAKLGLADLLKGGPKAPADLARAVGADPATLHRVLRALASVGVFVERKDGRFALTPLDMAALFASDTHRAVGHGAGCATGADERPSVDHQTGTDSRPNRIRSGNSEERR